MPLLVQQAALDPEFLELAKLGTNTPVLTTKAGVTDMLSKAGAGTAALSGLGKAGAKEDSKDSTLASADKVPAAGVQSSANLASSAPTRAEIQGLNKLCSSLKNPPMSKRQKKVQMRWCLRTLKFWIFRLDPPELGQMKIVHDHE